MECLAENEKERNQYARNPAEIVSARNLSKE